MKKSLYLAFIAALALSMGCIVTDYPVITDSEGDGMNFVVNTNGKAAILPSSQIITLWPDQDEELFSMIDQKFDGSAVITTHANVSAPYSYNFMGYTYCNPDWTGCAIATAETGGARWDYTYNINCEGARSVGLLIAYNSRIGECGRDLMRNPGLLNAMTGSFVDLGNAWGLNLNRSNTRLIGRDDMGHTFEMPLFGTTTIKYQKSGGMTIAYHNGMLPTVRAMSRVTADYNVNNWTIEYLGHGFSLDAVMGKKLLPSMTGL